MAKSRGSRLGSYEILALIGVGGMGEVYRARDPRLRRDVAIKILTDELTAHADRRARFEREARLLASVNHPNIGAIYGLEESDGELALVLELVDGQTLAERLLSGAVPVKAALSIGTQIAAALEAAHDLGIVHRDLKPQNIKLRPDGSVKVLDFGLAKTLDRGANDARDGSFPPTVTSADVTRAGTVLGTPAYMSPEQMHGRAIDKRADVWAFGCVLYELLTGRRAFGGEDLPGTIAVVLRTEPDWSLLPTEVPASVRTLLSRCLEKDAARRLRDIGDVRIMVEDASSPSSPALMHVHADAPAPTTRSRRATAFAAAGGAAIVLLVVVALYLRPDRATPVDATAAPQPPAADLAAESAPRDRGAAGQLPNSIAVLPLDHLSAEPNDAHLASGLHEEILTQLGKLRSLSPTSRTSVLQYAENKPSIQEIARTLRVGAIMEGSVRFEGTEVVVTARLVDPDTALTLWVDTFEADRDSAGELHAIPVDIATAIVRALGVEITAADRARIQRAPTTSAAAYASYFRARDGTFNYRFAEAVHDLDRAIALDPNFAEAYAQRAYVIAYGQITSNSRVQLLQEERFRDADFQALSLRDADRALELDAGTGLAWVARALTHKFHFRGREAGEAFARALDLSPNDASILAEYAGYHSNRGELDDALSKIRLAQRLDPNGLATLTSVAQTALTAGRTGESNDAIAEALAVAPASLEANLLGGLFSADPAAKERHLRAAEDLVVVRAAQFYLTAIAAGYRGLGLETDEDRALDRYFEWGNTVSIGAGDWARYYLARGDMDQVYVWLQTAVKKIENGESDAGFIPLLQIVNSTDPRLAEPRFRLLMDRLRSLAAD